MSGYDVSGVSELRHLPLFDGLTDDQLERLWSAGTRSNRPGVTARAVAR